jgi:hypothetical protein
MKLKHSQKGDMRIKFIWTLYLGIGLGIRSSRDGFLIVMPFAMLLIRGEFVVLPRKNVQLKKLLK